LTDLDVVRPLLPAVPHCCWQPGSPADAVHTLTFNVLDRRLVKPPPLLASTIMLCEPLDSVGVNCQLPDELAATTPRMMSPSTIVTRLPGVA